MTWNRAGFFPRRCFGASRDSVRCGSRSFRREAPVPRRSRGSFRPLRRSGRGSRGSAPGALPRDPRPLLRKGRKLPRDRRGTGASRRNDREPHLTLSREAPKHLRGKKPARFHVMKAGDLMSAYDIERLSRLIGMLPPAPAAWVRAARELRSEEHTSELQSRFGISYAVFFF